jgi:crossover junction endodeoxyribonuclease RuvC
MRILGVDPGAYGALALLVDGVFVAVHDMPIVRIRRGKTDKAEIEGFALARLVRELAPTIGVVELVGGMTGQSASAAFNFGRSAGAPEYILQALGVRTERVSPVRWKKALNVKPGKDDSRFTAMKLWPSSAGLFARKKDDGRAEAALIAHWFSLQQRGVENGVFA